ncbi:MAG: EamA family transporter [Opitutales bacterium]
MPAAILTAFLFALSGVCAAQSSRRLGAGRANAWRLLIALILLAAWAHTFGSGFSSGVEEWFLLAGAVGFGMGGWCMFQALRRAGSTLSLLIVECAAAVVATAIGWIWLGAALSPAEILFAGMILTGVVCGLFPGPIPTLSRPVVLSGACFALLGACFQAVSFNLSKKAFILLEQSGGRIDQWTAAYQRLLGGVVAALLLYGLGRYCFRRNQSQPDTNSERRTPLPTPVWVLGNALFGPVLGVSCMLWAIRLVDNPGIVQAVAATATLLTVPLACRLEEARPGLRYYAGCLTALAGIALLLV